jgi:hypothetical protein
MPTRIDAHVTETQFWPEIIARVDNDVIRQMGEAQFMRPGAGNTALLNAVPGMTYQPLHGRIPHQAGLLEPVDAKGCQVDLTRDPRWVGEGNRVTYPAWSFHGRHDYGFVETNWAGKGPGEGI